MDRLGEIFTRQAQLQRIINGYDLDDQTTETRIENIKLNVLACTAELHEALDEISWKQWATAQFFNENAFKKELIDVAHFLINLMLHAGMSSDEFFELYVAKNKRNFERQAEGYDGVSSKCPYCHRALDDVGVAQGRILGELTFECGGCRKGLPTEMIIGLDNINRIKRITKILEQTT